VIRPLDYMGRYLSTVKWAQWDKNPIQRLVKLFQENVQLHNATQYYITEQFC